MGMVRELRISDFRVTFDNSSIEALNQRMSLAATDEERARLALRIRIASGEDPAVIAWSLAPANNTDQVAIAQLESAAISNGTRIVVSAGDNHWNHFLTHSVSSQDIVDKLKANPNSDPIDAFTAVQQLGEHMQDHRDAASAHPHYVGRLQQMDAMLGDMSKTLKELQDLAQEEAERQAQSVEAPEGDDKLARQQASYAQRYEQRAQSAAAAACATRIRKDCPNTYDIYDRLRSF
jgi:hypothetical protein